MRLLKIYLLSLFTLILFFFTNAQTNSIKGVITNNFQTKTHLLGANTDHIQLPSLNLAGDFSIETWFKSNIDLVNTDYGNVRIFDFSSSFGANFTGAYLEFYYSASGGNYPELRLQLNQNYNPLEYVYPLFNIVSPNGWNHFAVTFTSDTIKLFANGINVAKLAQNAGFDSNYFRSNFIGRSNYPNILSTLGEFKDFRIWKTARTENQIQTNYLFPLNVELDSNYLYYYLPLTKNHLYGSQSIQNGTILQNASIWSQANKQPSTIISLNNVSAKYNYDSNSQIVYGYLASSAINNELIEYSIDNGSNWKKIDTSINNKWIATLPPNFKYGNIKVRSNNVNRAFADYRYDLIPVVSYSPNFIINIVGTQTNSMPATIMYSALNNDAIFSITNGGNNDITINNLTGQISIASTLPVGVYNLTISATNIYGVTYNNFTIYNGNVYSINTQVGSGGTTTPSGTFSLNQYSQDFIFIRPNSGYLIDSIFINGVKIANTDKLLFNNLTQNINIRVVFKQGNTIAINYIDELDSIGKNGAFPDTGRYVLLRDLDFNNPAHYSKGVIDSVNHITGLGWKSILFNGVFDGQNHTISNVYLGGRPTATAQFDRVRDDYNYNNGFFGNLGIMDTIKNLHIKNIVYLNNFIYKSFDNNIGSSVYDFAKGAMFIGINNGYITNCSVNGRIDNLISTPLFIYTVDVTIDVAGFVQNNTNTGVINNCSTNILVNDSSGDIINNDDRYPPVNKMYNFTGFVGTNAGIIENSFTKYNFIKPPVLSNPVVPFTPFYSSINGIEQKMPAGFIRYSKNGTITNCYALGNTNAPFYALIAGAQFLPRQYYINFYATITNSYTNSLNFASSSIINSNNLNDLTKYPSKNVDTTDANTINDTLKNNPNYFIKKGYFPFLRYSYDTTKLLPNQYKYIPLTYKTGANIKFDSVLYDLRFNFIARLLPPTGTSFDSIFINNIFYTRDSIYGITLNEVANLSSFTINISKPVKNISTIQELDSIGKYANYDNSGYYVLAKNLDFYDPNSYLNRIIDSNYINNNGFTPIPTFTGIFDGHGYSIKNVFIRKNSQDTIGFFKELGELAKVFNLKILNANVNGANIVGILAGFVNNGATIENCYVDGKDSGINKVGGIVGINNNGLISNSISKGIVKGASKVGGFVGSNQQGGSIKNSFTNSTVTSTIDGGLFGGENNASEINSCYAWGKISGVGNTGAFLNENINGANVSNCYTVLNGLFINNNTANSSNNKLATTLKTVSSELGNATAYLFRPNYYLPFLYKLGTNTLVDSQYMTLAEISQYRDTLKNLSYNNVDTIPINFRSNYTSQTPTIYGTPLPITYSLVSNISGITVNSAGIIQVPNNLSVGYYTIQVKAKNLLDSLIKNIVINIIPLSYTQFTYTVDSVSKKQSADSSVIPTITNTGLKTTFYITAGNNPFIKLDSNTGVISWTNKLISGKYDLTITAKNILQEINKRYIINIQKIADTILNNDYDSGKNVFTTYTFGGDYVQLPNLDISGNFTVETWFKSTYNLNTASVANWTRIFDFGLVGGQSNGVILGFTNIAGSNNKQIAYHLNGLDIFVNLPANFDPSGWNHYALTFNGATSNLYINGTLVNSTTDNTGIAANTCVSNFIGKSNWADPTTIGSFKEFRIWKVARTLGEISYYKDLLLNTMNSTNLYYYLPLTYLINSSIPNQLILNNNSTAVNALQANSIVNSINARYIYDNTAKYLSPFNKKLEIIGNYSDTILFNESLRYSLDTGKTWINITDVADNKWRFEIFNFNYGQILVSSNLSNRNFGSINIKTIPTNFTYTYNRIDTINNLSGSVQVKTIDKGGYANVKYKLIGNTNAEIRIDSNTGEISWTAYIRNGANNLTVEAYNQTGYVRINFILNIFAPVYNKILSYKNNSFETTTIGTGGLLNTTGDFIKLPSFDLRYGKYTIETNFKYNESTINAYKRIFEFSKNSNTDSSSILLCFKNGSTVSNPILILFAGAGQQADITIPASINIRNWNHYALVLKDSIVTLYINGNAIGGNKFGKAKNIYNYNYIAKGLDANATTRGNYLDFRVWNKARTAAEIKDNIKINILNYEDSLVYNLSLYKQQIATTNLISNLTKITNEAISKEAITDSSIIYSNQALYRYDSATQKVYGTILDSLQQGDTIKIKYNNSEWINIDTIVKNYWVGSMPENFIAGTIQATSIIKNRNFNTLNVQIKPSNFEYRPSKLNIRESVNDSTPLPYIRTSYPTIFKLKTKKNNIYSINENTGVIYWNNTIYTVRDTLLVTAKNDLDSVSTQLFLNIGDTISDFSYNQENFVVNFGQIDSSLEIANSTGTGDKKYSIISNRVGDISINANTGRITVKNVTEGTYSIQVKLENPLNYLIKTIVIRVNSLAPTYLNYTPNILSFNYGDNGVSEVPLVSNTGGILKYKIVSGNNPFINIDSLTGKIYTLGILNIGNYPIQVEASNNSGAVTNSFTINVLNLSDSIVGYTNSVIAYTSNGLGANGDYINLPTLALDSNYSVETWFNLNASTGPTFPFIYNFGGWQNTKSNGLILAGVGSRTLGIKSWGVEANVSAPNDLTGYVLTPNIWYHLAVVVKGKNTKVYVNGQIVKEYTSLGTPTNNNIFTNNRIGNGQDAGDLSTTLAKFRNFKIWKKPLSTAEITESYLVNTGTERQHLYYYLPLSNYANSTTNFNNFTNIANYAKNNVALDSISYIISKNNVGAYNYVDTNEQVIYGTLRDSIKINEYIQVSIDTGLSWKNAKVYRNNWQYRFINKPTTNQILVRGFDSTNNIVSRVFTPFGSKIKTNKITNFNYSPAKKILNYTFGGQSTLPIFNSDTLVQFRILQNPQPNFITINNITGVISINSNTPVINDSILIQAFNVYDTVSFYYKIQILPIKPSGLSYIQNNIKLFVGNTLLITATLNQTGGDNIQYSIKNNVNGVNINAQTGEINLLANLETGIYNFNVLVSNSIGYDSTNIRVEVKPYQDSILNFTGNSIQLTTNGNAANGDYIRLPTIKLDSSFTIETWFNLNPNTGNSYPFIYTLNGFNNGLFFDNGLNNSRNLIVKSWGIEANGANINFPKTNIIIEPNRWYHIAVVVNGRNTKVYINGVLSKEYTNFGNPTSNNTFTNNIIGNGQVAGNISTTLGKFKEFKIWDKAKSEAEINTYFQNQQLIFGTNLYYYLPLSNSNSLNSKISNNTNIQNASISNPTGLISVINSVNDSGARFITDTFLRKLYGTISSPLSENEILQYSLDKVNWNTISNVQGYIWSEIVPSTFRGGVIQVRSILNNENTNRKFNSIPYFTISDPVYNYQAILNNSNNNINVSFSEPIFKGGYDSISYYTIFVRNGNNVLSFNTKNTQYLLTGLADNTTYYISVQVVNASGISSKTIEIPILTNPSPIISTINSTLTGGVIAQSTAVKYGSNFTVTYLPFSGYKVDSIFINNEYNAAASNDTINELIISNITSNKTVRIVFAKTVYTIATSISLNGTISNSANVFYGDSVPVTFTINQGYKLDSIFIDEVYNDALTISNLNKYTFYNINKSHTFRVVLSIIKYKIIATTNNGGIVKNISLVNYGNNFRITYSQQPGYAFDSLFVNNVYVPDSNNGYTFNNMYGDSLIYFKNKLIKYNIRLTIINGGSVLPNSDTIITVIDTIQFNFNNNNNLYVDSVWVNNEFQVNTKFYIFKNIISDQILQVKFKTKPANTSNIESVVFTAGGGSIYPAGNIFVTNGESQQFIINNNIGYILDKILVNNNKVDSTFSYTFNNINGDSTIYVYFAFDSFTIQSSSNNGGIITPSLYKKITYFDSLTYTITPNIGYYVDSLFVNDSLIDIVSNYTFKKLTKNSSIRAVFKRKTFTITASNNEGGSINPTGIDTVFYGETLIYQFNINEGYLIDSIIVDGVNKSKSNAYNFINITSNHTIKIVFKKIEYTITAIALPNGIISPSEISKVFKDSSITYTITPNTGYLIDKVWVDENLVTLEGNKYTFDKVNTNHTIRVSFVLLKLRININIVANGQSSPVGPILIINYGTDTTINIIPNEGYVLDTLLINGTKVDNTNIVILRNVITEQNIYVKFIKTFTIEAFNSTGGVISPAGINKVIYGQNLRFTITPNTDYELDSLLIDNIKVTNASSYTFLNVTTNHTIKAVFKFVKAFTIEAINNTGGVISPAGINLVNYGQNISFTITPNAGYLLDSLIIDNVKVDNTTNYTFTNVISNHTIKAIFKLDCANLSKRTPIIVRTGNNLSSDLTFATYTWYKDGNVQISISNNIYTPSSAGVYTLMGTEANACLSNLSKKYYYALSCITPAGRLGNGAYIQGNIVGDDNQIIVKWCPEIIQNQVKIQIIDMNGVLLNEQIVDASSGIYIINKQIVQSKQFLIQVMDINGALLQISDIINN